MGQNSIETVYRRGAGGRGEGAAGEYAEHRNRQGSDFRSERRVFQNDNQVQDAEFGRSNVRPAYVDYGNGGADQAS